MTQQELAFLCNFEKSNMSRIEKGKTNPTILTLQKISKALKVPLEDLLKSR
jgi:transcriptional regulator with XRE-family HTH domain